MKFFAAAFDERGFSVNDFDVAGNFPAFRVFQFDSGRTTRAEEKRERNEGREEENPFTRPAPPIRIPSRAEQG